MVPVLKSPMRLFVLCFAGLVLLAAGYSLIGLHRAQRAPPSLEDLSVHYDIAYASGARHGLDVYAPRNAEARPVVVYFYGGGWTSGEKRYQSWVAAALARRGYVAVVPDYRVYPQAVWPAFLQDNAAAIRWVRDNIARYGGDPAQIVLMGHSAGAFNAVTLAVDRRWLAQVGLDPRRDVKAVVGLSGPYNFLPLTGKTEKMIFGPRTGYTDMLSLIDGRSPPILMVVGDNDEFVDTRDTLGTAGRIREKGGSARSIIYPGLGHNDTVDAISGTFSAPASPVAGDVFAFIRDKGVGRQGWAARAK